MRIKRHGTCNMGASITKNCGQNVEGLPPEYYVYSLRKIPAIWYPINVLSQTYAVGHCLSTFGGPYSPAEGTWRLARGY